jgi:hypothetical protein
MTVERNIISVEFDLPLPNEFMVDHSFSEGKSRKYTYHGPDKIWLQIGEDGTEKYGPLEASDISDGRPVPVDVVEWFEVDCREYPLICQLRAGIINELQEDYTSSEWHPQSPEIPGYDRYSYGTPLMPMDVFDKWKLKVVDGVPTVPPYSVNQKLHDRDEPLTWDDIRKHRDKILKTSDTEIAEDMPESLKQKWMEYRQTLRDLPSVLEEAGVPPDIAYYMFPNVPDYREPD